MSKYNILLVGPVGSGKTHSLRTLVEDCGKEVFIIGTEPGVDTVLKGNVKQGIKPLPEDSYHLSYITPAKTDWKILSDNAKLLNLSDLGTLQKSSAPGRNKFDQFIKILAALANFKDDRTGKEYGPVDSWTDTNRVLAIDGLSGLSTMALDLVCGAKPIRTQPEWGAAMDTLLRLIRKLCSDTQITFVLLAHLERQEDPTRGGTHLTVSTLGNKLAPELIKPFDEIILAKRNREKFIWSTTEMGVDLKTRTLGWGDDYEATFKHFFEKEAAAA